MLGLPGDDGDDHARYLEASFGPPGAEARVASIYLPNGNPSDDPAKFNYKLAWMDRLNEHVSGLLRREIPFVLAGDYNICPTDDDVYDPVAFRDDALCRIESRSRFRALLYQGLTDCYRVFHPEPHKYTCTHWDYRSGQVEARRGELADRSLAAVAASPPTGSSGAISTNRRAARSAPPTTPRSGASWRVSAGGGRRRGRAAGRHRPRCRRNAPPYGRSPRRCAGFRR